MKYRMGDRIGIIGDVATIVGIDTKKEEYTLKWPGGNSSFHSQVAIEELADIVKRANEWKGKKR